MLLINIPIVWVPQRLMDPSGSDTEGSENSPGDPAGTALVPLHPRSGKTGEAPIPNVRHLAGDSPEQGAGMDPWAMDKAVQV